MTRFDDEAVNFIVEKCKNSIYGAREISAMLAKSLIRLSPQEMKSESKNCAVLEVLDENLFFNNFYDESFTAPKCCKPKEVIPYNLASELLCDIEDFASKSEKTFNSMEELGDNLVEYAANLILHFKESLQYFEDFSLEMTNFTEAEVLLLASLHTYLVNYYIDYPEYRKPTYLRQFLATVYPKDYDDIFMSPIEFIFNDWYELGVEDGEIWLTHGCHECFKELMATMNFLRSRKALLHI